MSSESSLPMAWRTSLVRYLVLGAWAILALRLGHLQWYQHAELTRLTLRQSEVEVVVPARPADIVDRNGKMLATTVTTPSLFVDPTRLKVTPEFVTQLAEAVHLDPQELTARLHDYREKRFMWVKRRLSEQELAEASALKWPDGACGFREEFLRQYPQDELAAHVLGLRNIDGEGKGGVEESLDGLIRGQAGRRKLGRDARGRIVEVDFSAADAPQRFQSVQLSIDLAVQMFAERELDKICADWKPRAATAIVLDPQTGELLGMASRPTYSPSQLEDVPEEAWKNQAISIVYEPGSTFKPLIVAWGLQQQAINRDDHFYCERGSYQMIGRSKPIRDVHGYGELSVMDVLVKSSNIGMAKIGLKLGNESLFEATYRFGFGRPTGVELPGELSGILAPLRKWTSYSTGSIPMGQEIAVTPLQLIVAHAALANGGRLISPRILHGVQGDGSNAATTLTVSADDSRLSIPPRIVSTAIDPEVANWIVQEPLTQVVRRGTGVKAKLPGYSVFGKTGTAQKFDPKTKTYSTTKFIASFLCGAPSVNPRVMVLVIVDEPRSARSFGGVVAAPAASRILQRTLLHLRVPQDQQERSAGRGPERTAEVIDFDEDMTSLD